MRFAIVVGHNPRDKGAVAYDGTSEFEFNSILAELVVARLDCAGHDGEVFKHGTFGGYSTRQRETAARIEDAGHFDAHIELHFNAANASAEGFEHLHHFLSKRGEKLANCLNAAHAEIYPGARNRGVKSLGPNSRGFVFVRLTSAPRVIVEPFFGDNPADASEYLNESLKLAAAIVAGLDKFSKV